MRLCILCFLFAICVSAQDSHPLYFFNTEVVRQPDGFGGEMPVAHGDLFNHGADAYTNIALTLIATDADDNIIGEGFGYLTDACGNALLDFALPPGAHQPFNAPFELFADGEIAHIELSASADPVAPPPPLPDMPAVKRISEREAVMLRWLDAETLIFGAGCDGALFSDLDWQRYSLADKALADIEHPDAAKITPELIENSGAATITQSGELNPDLFARSQLAFPPGARRAVYQNDLHTLFSAEADGSYPRMIHDGLHQYSLRGFQWARQPGVFLAVYFGSHGEPVRYFAADADGRLISQRLEAMPPSLTMPAPSADGRFALVGRVANGVSGYWLQNSYGNSELLFEADLPGSNFPAPILLRERVYIVAPGDDAPMLRRYGRETGELCDVTPLPLRLEGPNRAWMELSPGGDTLALSANGADGGVWLTPLGPPVGSGGGIDCAHDAES